IGADLTSPISLQPGMPGAPDYSDTNLWTPLGGTAGGVYQYMGNATTGANLDLASQDYTDLDFWKPVFVTQLIPQGNSITESDASSFAGLVVLNDVRGGAIAKVYNSNIAASSGDILVKATEAASIVATDDNSSTASGGTSFGTGSATAAIL